MKPEKSVLVFSILKLNQHRWPWQFNFKEADFCTLASTLSGSTDLPRPRPGNRQRSLTHPSVSHRLCSYHMVLNGLFVTLSAFLIERGKLCVCVPLKVGADCEQSVRFTDSAAAVSPFCSPPPVSCHINKNAAFSSAPCSSAPCSSS